MTTTVFNSKIGEVKIKIPDVNGLVKKMDYSTKLSDIERKYFVALDYNKFMAEIGFTKLD